MKSVLLVSKFNWDSPVEIPYIFNKAGFKVYIYCPANSWLTFGSFYHSYIEAPEDEEAFIANLINTLKHHKFDWIQLTEDPLIDFIKQSIKDDIILNQLLPVKCLDAIEILSSKIGFSHYFQRNGVPTPLFKCFINGVDSEEHLKSIKFPVLNKYDLSWGGTDISISYSFAELQNKLQKIPSHANLLIQEYIDGLEIRVDALFYEGKLLNYFCARVLENTKDRFSYTTRREYFEYKPIAELLVRIGEKVGAHGFANICFIKEKTTSMHYLIEMDMRPNSWMAYSEHLSKNHFIYSLKNIQQQGSISFTTSELRKQKPIELALFYKDIRRAIWAKDLKGISRWIFGINGYWRFLPFYDLRLSKKVFIEIWREIGVFKLKKLKKQVGL